MRTPALAIVLLAVTGDASAQTGEAPMMLGHNGFSTTALLTVGEFVANIDGDMDYQLTGIPDGMGAIELDDNTIRVFVNHEFSQSRGTAFSLANGAEFPSGARVSIFDIDKRTLEIVRGGLGIARVIVDGGVELDPGNIDRYIADYSIINRLCSATMAGPADGLRDFIFFTGEETSGGRVWALDAATRTLYEIPAMGNGAWESAIVVPTVGTPAEGLTVVVLGDDSSGRPLYLYVGEQGPQDGGFLERNGLADGQLYALVTRTGANTNTEFAGTGRYVPCSWVALHSNNPSEDITGDGRINLADDIQNMRNLVAEAGAIGAFFFSRPEDVSVNPVYRHPRHAQVVLAATGRVTNLGDIDGDGINDIINDPWGTSYIVTIDLGALARGMPGDSSGNFRAGLRVAYDANEPDKQDFGIRNPDNLDWADDGFIYEQEDRSTSRFGDDSGIEASIWRLDPRNADAIRIAIMDRTAVPDGQVDTDPDDLGDWESSGIVDISEFLADAPGGSVFVFNVQAHSVRGGNIGRDNLVQGGQVLLLHANRESDNTQRFQLEGADESMSPFRSSLHDALGVGGDR